MSAYVDDINSLIDFIDENRIGVFQDRCVALRVGCNIEITSKSISCVGEKEFREFLRKRGNVIVSEVGDDDFYAVNPEPDFALIRDVIEEVYERLQFELPPPTQPRACRSLDHLSDH
ncbi:MAG: hypothetical protein ACFB03_17915 [Paracoccaceae bacterium]